MGMWGVSIIPTFSLLHSNMSNAHRVHRKIKYTSNDEFQHTACTTLSVLTMQPFSHVRHYMHNIFTIYHFMVNVMPDKYLELKRWRENKKTSADSFWEFSTFLCCCQARKRINVVDLIVPKNYHQQGVLISSKPEWFALVYKIRQRKDTPSKNFTNVVVWAKITKWVESKFHGEKKVWELKRLKMYQLVIRKKCFSKQCALTTITPPHVVDSKRSTSLVGLKREYFRVRCSCLAPLH